jgi:hypothetical protein
MDFFTFKRSYYKSLDQTATSIADSLSSEQKVTADILQVIIDLYKSAKVELDFADTNKFQSAYHSPITSELEFFISRILFHFSEKNNLGWTIYLRKQKGKTAPDIRIARKEKTIAIIEIKAKAGWIQPLLSQDRYDSDMLRLSNGKSKFNPDDLIASSKNQLQKYQNTFELDTEDIYFFLPTLCLVHRKRYDKQVWDYCGYFEKTSGLSRDNLILLSSNMLLDLSRANSTTQLQPTSSFERMIYKLKRTNK